MFSEDDQQERILGLTLTIPLYFLVLLLCAVWAHRRNRQEVDSVRYNCDRHNVCHQEARTDTLTSHYLGGRSLGPILTAGTIFASFFSGYTFVGIPNEAYQNGWMALRWLAGSTTVQVGFFGTGLRFRKMALIRNHKTPVDFITDRFQSQILRYTVLILQVVPSTLYISGQVVALKSTCNSIFDFEPENPYPAIIVMTITLLFEWIGGLRCVAMTDCIQGAIMIIAYACLPIILLKHFGGWRHLSPSTYPKPEFYANPSLKEQWDFWQYTLSTFSLFTLPHLMQRTYATKDLVSLKSGYLAMSVGMWFLQLGAVYVGTMAVAILQDEENEITSPFTEVLGKIIDLGGFGKVIGLFTVTASIAASMSTADSFLISISQLITEEIIYPNHPNATPRDMAWVGRAVSFVAIVVASLMGLAWEEGVTELASVNYQMSTQTVIIFVIGLFGTEKFDCHPWSLAASAITATLYVVSIYFGYITAHDNPLPISAGMTGLALQVVVLTICESTRCLVFAYDHEPNVCLYCRGPELLFPHRPIWDIPKRARFGEKPLTPTLIWKMMKGIREPLADPWFAALFFISISMITPWVLPLTPSNISDLEQYSVNGIPWWAVKILVLCACNTVLVLSFLIPMPHHFPAQFISKKVNYGSSSLETAEVSDPELLELTPEEMGHRVVYDARNELVYKRRRQILEHLGIAKTEIDAIVQSTQQQLRDFELEIE